MIYSVRMSTSTPYKLQFIDNAGNECNTSAILSNTLSINYFNIDTRHDTTSSGAATDEKELSKGIIMYKTRFSEKKFMLIGDNDFSTIADIGLDGPGGANNFEIRVHNVTNAGDEPDITFKEYITNILDIGLPDKPNVQRSCDPTRTSLYEYMTIYNIYDMGSQFPDKIPSPSYIIDSAPAGNHINAVPNICRLRPPPAVQYDLLNWVLPNIANFNTIQNNHSLLFFGDLQISNYFCVELSLADIANNASNIVIDPTVTNLFTGQAADDIQNILDIVSYL